MNVQWTWRQAGSGLLTYTQLLRDGTVAGEIAFTVPGHTPWPSLLNDQIVALLNKHNDTFVQWDAADLAGESRALEQEAVRP